MADALAREKKPESGEDDVFVRSLVRLGTWARNNGRTVLVGLAGIVIVGLGGLYYVNFQQSVRDQAAVELARLRLSATAPELLVPDLETYVERFEGTESADEARLILVRLYLDTDRATDAARVAASVATPVNRPVGFAARRLLGAAQEAEADFEAALATYESLAEDARFPFQQRQVQASAARILAKLGRFSEALAIYETLAVEAEPEDPTEAGVYRLRVGEIKSRQRATPSN